MAPLKASLILKVVARACLLPGLAVSAWVLWVGHNAPGGGFIAGLMTLAVLSIEMMAFSHSWSKAWLDRLAPWLTAGGLGLAAATSAASLVLGYPFLTSARTAGGFSSAFFFDLGVYGVVVGAGLLILRIFGDPSHA